MTEKRKYSRLEESLEINYQILYSLGFGSSVKEGEGVTESIDLSEGGISIILTGEQIPEGSLLEIRLNIPNEKLPLYLKGEVVRVENISKGKYKVGVKFDYKVLKDSEILYNYLGKIK